MGVFRLFSIVEADHGVVNMRYLFQRRIPIFFLSFTRLTPPGRSFSLTSHFGIMVCAIPNSSKWIDVHDDVLKAIATSLRLVAVSDRATPPCTLHSFNQVRSRKRHIQSGSLQLAPLQWPGVYEGADWASENTVLLQVGMCRLEFNCLSLIVALNGVCDCLDSIFHF